MKRTSLLIEALKSGDDARRRRQRELSRDPGDITTVSRGSTAKIRGGDEHGGHKIHMAPHVGEFDSATSELLALKNVPRKDQDLDYYDKFTAARRRVAAAGRKVRAAAKEIGREGHEFLAPLQGESKRDHVHRMSHFWTTNPRVRAAARPGDYHHFSFDMRQERDHAMKAANHWYPPKSDDDRHMPISNPRAGRYGHSFHYRHTD